MFNLTGKVALITGASSGIGRASALALAGQGARVAVCARRLDKLETLVTEITGKGGSAIAVAMDVTKRESVDQAVAMTVKTFGRLDILANCAGALDYSPFLEMTEEKWDLIIDTNLKGYYYTSQAAGKEMAKNKWGRIINIASIASGGVGVGMAMLTHYTASKGGVIGLTEAMAVELGSMGILVNAIAPGAIDTEMTKGSDMTPYFGRLAVKRIGTPEEIAAGVVYFASDEAAYTTGTTLYIDGGWTAS